jgi:hypothetical protein
MSEMEEAVRKFHRRTNPSEVAFAFEPLLPCSRWREDRTFHESDVPDHDDVVKAALRRARQIGIAFVRVDDCSERSKLEEPAA